MVKLTGEGMTNPSSGSSCDSPVPVKKKKKTRIIVHLSSLQSEISAFLRRYIRSHLEPAFHVIIVAVMDERQGVVKV